MYAQLKINYPEWNDIISTALKTMDHEYMEQLLAHSDWLPGTAQMLASFNLPLSKVRYVLLGESPYPRSESANGYAFWDNAVTSLWSSSGLSKAVNRATSLRNWIKMLLVARGDLAPSDTGQQAITAVDKTELVGTAEEFFQGLMNKGILLLNASLVYSEGKVPYHARHWKKFMQSILEQLAREKPDTQLILFGKIAEQIPQNTLPVGLVAEHPYNISFINNPRVIDFFKPLDLLSHDSL